MTSCVVVFFFLSSPLLSSSVPLCFNWLCRWHDINNMSHNRSFFALELANREESVQYQTVSNCSVFYIPSDIAVCYWILIIWRWPLSLTLA